MVPGADKFEHLKFALTEANDSSLQPLLQLFRASLSAPPELSTTLFDTNVLRILTGALQGTSPYNHFEVVLTLHNKLVIPHQK